MEETRGRKDGKRGERAEARRKNNTAGEKTQQEDDFEETYLHMLAGHEWVEHEDDMMRTPRSACLGKQRQRHNMRKRENEKWAQLGVVVRNHFLSELPQTLESEFSESVPGDRLPGGIANIASFLGRHQAGWRQPPLGAGLLEVTVRVAPTSEAGAASSAIRRKTWHRRRRWGCSGQPELAIHVVTREEHDALAAAVHRLAASVMWARGRIVEQTGAFAEPAGGAQPPEIAMHSASTEPDFLAKVGLLGAKSLLVKPSLLGLLRKGQR